ncbi:hypothetical protein [Sciscionella sediminilitoris]|uniref:hypothetical protein n=1 Tax=Sciscionella sediminilitoris TaxID=1445613 RepID=UPI0004DF29DF|nr:hypothetical protein [Sciscionella sp. SE31]
MFLIEIAYPAGALTETERDTIAASITELITAAEQAPEATMRRARRMTHIAFRELHGWHTGDGPVHPGAAPPVLASITVPEAWRAETARHTMGAVRSAITGVDRVRGWTREGGDLWINVFGVAEGSIGLNGKAADADAVLAYMTEEFRALAESGELGPVPDGKLLDPVCGMLVHHGKGTILLDHDGVTLGFCAQSCRDAYAREHGLSPA